MTINDIVFLISGDHCRGNQFYRLFTQTLQSWQDRRQLRVHAERDVAHALIQRRVPLTFPPGVHPVAFLGLNYNRVSCPLPELRPPRPLLGSYLQKIGLEIVGAIWHSTWPTYVHIHFYSSIRNRSLHCLKYWPCCVRVRLCDCPKRLAMQMPHPPCPQHLEPDLVLLFCLEGGLSSII